MSGGVGELSARARDIFRIAVETYIQQGQPVGSRTLAEAGHFNLSPASIRNVLQELEERGLLASPHTSAGRVPTDSGLRLFVDALMHVAEPSAEDRAQIEAHVRPGPVGEALSAASQALSGLSSCAGLVLVPKQDMVLRQVAFMPLSESRALAVIVGADGSVENRVVQLLQPTPESALIAAGNYVTAHFAGKTLRGAMAAVSDMLQQGQTELDGAARNLIERGLADWSHDGERPVLIVRGQANLLDDRAYSDLERVRLLLEELETQREIAALLNSAREGDATRIFIGAENKLFALSGSSVIASPWRGADGGVIGVVGIIGPTRLNYARIVPMVDFTAQTLTRLMR